MQNLVQDDCSLQITADADVTGGSMDKVGGLVGVYVADAANGSQAVLMLRGVYSNIPCETGAGQDGVVGDPLYWDDTNHRLTKTSSSNTFCGHLAVAKGTTDATCTIRLSN